ncbi:hypothetical protein Lspi_0440 [Legionella spiritensis]|uniref:ImpA N-terminal domain-containing protein n=2 Tax=Legionella spiritensis TaxID=452 RepID=A0A0W0Z9D6_LEGSP|nr:hypothetical protein Lspi_0440 [Legionella spiritensis]SNV43238.1 Uncharacterized protein conserved in bacteria [Legionella spiritensis]
MADIAYIAKLGKKAIPGEHPSGYDCHAMPGYQFIRNEIGKLTDVAQVTEIDWEQIINESVAILQFRSKDILVACYLAYALVRQYGCDGLQTGSLLIYNLLYYYFDGLYPQNKPKTLGNAISWYFEHGYKYLQHQEFDYSDTRNIKRTMANLEAIYNITRSHKLDISCHEKFQQQLKTLSGEQQPEEPENTPEAKKTESLPAPSIPEASESQVGQQQGFTILLQSARHLLETSVTDPYAYYLNRIASWGMISTIPVIEEGNTLVAPPDSFNMERIKLPNQNPVALIRLIEEILPQEPFWFDLQIMALDLLQKAGEDFQPCHDVVKQEFFHLLHRFPGMELLTFNDGTPFLNEKHAITLTNLKATKLINAAERISDLTTQQQDQLRNIKQVISNLPRKNYARELNQLDLINKEAISDKVKLIAYISICEELLQRSNYDILKPYLGFMLDIIKTHQLNTWDPCIALEALVVLYRGLKAMPGAPIASEQDLVFSMITKIDMNIAFELSQSY